MPNSPLGPPILRAGLPIYPPHLQLLRVTGTTVPGPSGVAQVAGSSVLGPMLYVAFTQQMRDDGSMLPRDREPCLADSVRGIALTPGFYLGRLASSWTSLPVYEVIGEASSSSSSSVITTLPSGTTAPTSPPADGASIFYIQYVWNGTDWTTSSVLWIWIGLAWLGWCPCTQVIPTGYPSIGTVCCGTTPLYTTAHITFSGAGCSACLLAGNPWAMTHSLVGSDHLWTTTRSQSDDCDAGGGVKYFVKCDSVGAWTCGPSGSGGAGFCFTNINGTVSSVTCDPFHAQGTQALAGTGCGSGTVNWDMVMP